MAHGYLYIQLLVYVWASFCFSNLIVFQEQTVTKALETSHEKRPGSQWRTLFT